MKGPTLSQRKQTSDPEIDFLRRERRLEAIRSQALQTGQIRTSESVPQALRFRWQVPPPVTTPFRC